MVLSQGYLKRDNDKVFKFQMNNSSFLEASVFLKSYRVISAAP